jgi:sortase A
LTDTVVETTREPSGSEEPGGKLAAAILRGIGWTFIWLGLLTVGFVAHQIYLTTWLAQQEQAELTTERLEYFEEAEVQRVIVDETGTPIADAETGEPITVEPGFVPPIIIEGDPSNRTPTDRGPLGVEPLEMILESSPRSGRAFANITVPSLPRLENGWNVVEGVELRQLRKGAGHMPWTPLPGQLGNAVISGHRTTHGAPFHEFNELEPGDEIRVETAIGVHIYAVRKVMIVRPTALWVTDRDGPAKAGVEGGDQGSWLTLTTCHPKFSARQRLIVFAELVGGPNFAAIDRLTS